MPTKVSTPRFDGTNYARYRKLVKLWEKVTEVKDTEKGSQLILNMSGPALDIALSIEENKTTVDNLLTILDKVYVAGNNLSLKFDDFDQMKRPRDQNMREFVHLYEQKAAELKSENLTLPDLVLANKLLRAANLLPEHYLLARSTCGDMTMANAKKALLRITERFEPSKTTEAPNIKIKMEPDDDAVLFTENFQEHNEHYGHAEPHEVYFQNGRFKSRNPYSKTSSGGFQCWGCGGNSHMQKDCPNKFRGSNNRGNHPVRLCYGCGDGSHWIKDCPYLRDLQALIRNQRTSRNRSTNYVVDNGDNANGVSGTMYSDEEIRDQEEDKPVFFQSDVGNECEDILLVGETINKAVLDCGASKTVCGVEWFNCYKESMSEKLQKEIKEFSSRTIFKFGVGKLEALKMVHLPVLICDQQVTLEVHIVDTDIPLLLSLQTMKKLGLHMNFETDQIEIGGTTYNLEMTSTGHYTLQISPSGFCSDDCIVNTVNTVTDSKDVDLKNKALKLHKRFAHASSQRIITLLRYAGQSNTDLEHELEQIDKSCDFCLKHSRAAPRPVVSLPLANEFNELIAMDLKQIQGTWVLHCLDYLTRFSAAHVVKEKDPNEIIEKFFRIWVSIFGPPRKVLSDNGGEFKGKKWDAFCENFNVTHKSTAAESPFSNGICERHNALIGEMTNKVIKDVGCSLDVALMWSVHAKNSLINIYGFSPYQLVMGRNPNIPGNSTNQLPALNDHTASKLVADHLNGLHKAREAYTQAENSNRIARALRGRVYERTHQRFCIGDTVYFKRLQQKNWQGPGKVIAQDGTQVLVKTGSGTLIKVHPCKLILKEEADSQLNGKTTEQSLEKSNNTSDGYDSSDSSVYEEVVQPADSQLAVAQPVVVQPAVVQPVEETSSDEVRNNSERELNSNDEQDTNNSVGTLKSKRKGSKSKTDTLKPGDKIYFKTINNAEDQFHVVTLTKRGGKKGGKYPNYWNVKDIATGKESGVDLDQVDWMKESDSGIQITHFADQMVYEACIQNFDSTKSDKYAKAKEAEREKWREFNVYEEVNRNDYPNTDVLSCRWVTSSKDNDGEIVHKARLVIRGFEENGAPPSDSPTAQRSLARMCIILCNWNRWEIQSLDVRSAFLQSNDLDRTILMKPPKEFRKDSSTVWKIKKPIYGLNDGARKWFITMKNKLVEYGCKSLRLDPSVYVYHHHGELCGFCVVHVDDFLLGGNDNFHNAVVSKLCKDFRLSSKKSQNFKYIGWDINQDAESIEIDQIGYQTGIMPIETSQARINQANHELNDLEKKSYQQLLGKLQWITSQSRPDMRFAVLECSLRASKPKVSDIIAINKVVKKLKKTELKITIMMPSCSVEDLQILAFSDAALSNLPDRTSSTRSYVIFVKSGFKLAPITWCSKKIERVAKTIIYAEGIALGKCLDEAINLRETMLDALNLGEKENVADLLPIVGVTDSKSLWENIKSSSLASDLKLRREVSAIKEQIILKEVSSVVWTNTHLQLADCLTKKTASPENLLRVLNAEDFNLDLKTYSVRKSDILNHLGLE